MIQAVTDDEERGALGMHYTSVPNILKEIVAAQHLGHAAESPECILQAADERFKRFALLSAFAYPAHKVTPTCLRSDATDRRY